MMGILLFIVAAFVMFSLAFILIARFVALIFLIILAPIGFAGLAVPQLSVTANKWWSTLFEQTITAPVLLLLLYIALLVITDANFLFSGSSAPDYLGFVQNANGGFNLQGFASILVSFLVAMGLLAAVSIFSKKLSAFGGGWAMSTAGKLTFGLTAAGMRTTGGWVSQRASQGWRKMGLSRVPILGRTVSSVLDRGAKASFDVRGATIGGGLKGVGIEAGAAQTGGFREWEKGKIKEREEYAKTLEQTTGKFLGIGSGLGEAQEQKDAKLRVTKAAAAVKTVDNVDTREELENAETALKDIQSKPQTTYANRIEWGPGKFFQRNVKAAENIRKEARKSKSDKDFDALKKLLEENAKKASEGEGEKKEEPAASAAH